MSNMSSGEQESVTRNPLDGQSPRDMKTLGIMDVDIHRKQHEERHYNFEDGHDLDRYCPVVLASEKFVHFRTVLYLIAKRCWLDAIINGPSRTGGFRPMRDATRRAG